MKARSSDYWRERAEKRMDEAVLQADLIADRIGTAYLEALRDIQKRLDSIFRNFSAGISEAEAKRILKTVKEPDIIKRLEKAVERIENAEKRALMLAEINAPAYRARIDSLNTLAGSVKSVCEKIGGKTLELMDSELPEIAESTYYRSIFDTQKGTGLGFAFALLSRERIDEILLTNWSGRHYSHRVWDNTEKLAEAVQEILLQGFLTGRSSARMASDLRERMHSSYSRSLTLIRTEASYIANSAELESCRETGAEKYRFVATLDLRTSDICRSLDGTEYPIAEARQGENYPPMHPRCRSTTVPVLSDEVMSDMKRRAKDPVTGKPVTVSADMTYEEWYGRYVKGNAEAEVNEKAVRNLSSDRKQFERYKNLLGKEMPGTLEEFQRIKYTDTHEYGVLKAQVKGMGYYNAVLKNEPDISDAIKKVANEEGLEIAGFKHRIKNKESYLRKIRSDYSVNGNNYEVNDIIRYTFISDADNFTEKSANAIVNLEKKSYNTIKIKNYWLDDTSPYKGINTIAKADNGQKFEIQYHTPESYRVKEEMHKCYEQWRLLKDKSSETAIDLQRKMYEMSASLVTPNETERLTRL